MSASGWDGKVVILVVAEKIFETKMLLLALYSFKCMKWQQQLMIVVL